MSKPIYKKIMGGSVKFISEGDEYNFEGQVKKYEKSKVVFSIAGLKGATEIPKDVFEAITKYLGELDVKAKMKNWQ